MGKESKELYLVRMENHHDEMVESLEEAINIVQSSISMKLCRSCEIYKVGERVFKYGESAV